MAQLIGTAGTLVARRRGISALGDRPPMVSVTNADPERIAELLDEFAQDVRTVLPPVLSIRNGRRSVVITGTPEQLARFELYCQQIAEKEEAERKNKVRGGAVFSPVFDPVQVEVGFHTPAAGGRRRHGRHTGPGQSAWTSTWPARWPRPSSCARWTGSARSTNCMRRAPAGSSTSAPATS